MALPHAKPGEVIDLSPLCEELSTSRTAAIVKANRFEAIRLIVRAGVEIPPHRVPGDITLHCLEGHVSLGLADSAIDLSSGEWVYLEGGELHSVKGIENSSLLLTILFEKD